ncbi:MAG: CZB domain-containing protein, partial [Planctomycetales bacterium]|nr:CZB domain-containing protein [Planctomycetales bacterium]
KWYYEGDGQRSFSKVDNFSDLERPHAQVHDATRRLFALMRNNHLDDTEQVLQSIKDMERGSQGVFNCLDQLLANKKH